MIEKEIKKYISENNLQELKIKNKEVFDVINLNNNVIVIIFNPYEFLPEGFYFNELVNKEFLYSIGQLNSTKLNEVRLVVPTMNKAKGYVDLLIVKLNDIESTNGTINCKELKYSRNILMGVPEISSEYFDLYMKQKFLCWFDGAINKGSSFNTINDTIKSVFGIVGGKQLCPYESKNESSSSLLGSDSEKEDNCCTSCCSLLSFMLGNK